LDLGTIDSPQHGEPGPGCHQEIQPGEEGHGDGDKQQPMSKVSMLGGSHPQQKAGRPAAWYRQDQVPQSELKQVSWSPVREQPHRIRVLDPHHSTRPPGRSAAALGGA